MTKREIEQLRTIISALPEEPNSSQLDKQILEQAIKNAPRAPRTKLSLMFGQLAPVAASVLITIGAFFLMGELVKSKPSQLVQSAEPATPISNSMMNPAQQLDATTANQKALPRIGRPASVVTTPAIRPQPEALLNQKILIELPTTSALLGQMEFALESDRAEAFQAIHLAMNDIRAHLGSGATQEARKRYERLRQNCSICQLPTSLEALAVINGNTQGRI